MSQTLPTLPTVLALREMGIELPIIRLAWSIQQVSIAPETVSVTLSTARTTDTRRGTKITHRGLWGRCWTRPDMSAPWHADEPFVVEVRLATPEEWVSSCPDLSVRYESYEWARLCYRPGSDVSPMDGPGGSRPSVR